MAARKPLVINAGQVQQLQAGDTLDAAVTQVDVVSMTNAESVTIVIGAPVYVFSASNVKKAKADASGTSKVIGLVRDVSVAASASGVIQTDGVLVATTVQWDAITGGSGGLTAGSRYYLDPATGGMLTLTAPTTVGQFVCPIGIALSTTDLEITIGDVIGL